MNPPIPVPVDLVTRLDGGATQQQCANHYGVSLTTVKRWLQTAEVAAAQAAKRGAPAENARDSAREHVPKAVRTLVEVMEGGPDVKAAMGAMENGDPKAFESVLFRAYPAAVRIKAAGDLLKLADAYAPIPSKPRKRPTTEAGLLEQEIDTLTTIRAMAGAAREFASISPLTDKIGSMSRRLREIREATTPKKEQTAEEVISDLTETIATAPDALLEVIRELLDARQGVAT